VKCQFGLHPVGIGVSEWKPLSIRAMLDQRTMFDAG
jgi:hypothetical protein